MKRLLHECTRESRATYRSLTGTVAGRKCRVVHTHTCRKIVYTYRRQTGTAAALERSSARFPPAPARMTYTHMYMCMTSIHTYMCMYMHMYIHMYIHTYIHMYIHMCVAALEFRQHLYVSSCVRASMNSCIHACIYTSTHAYPYMNAQTLQYASTHKRARAHTHTHTHTPRRANPADFPAAAPPPPRPPQPLPPLLPRRLPQFRVNTGVRTRPRARTRGRARPGFALGAKYCDRFCKYCNRFCKYCNSFWCADHGHLMARGHRPVAAASPRQAPAT